MMTRPPPIASYFVSIVCLALFVTSTMSACNQSQRADTIHASIIAVDAARDGFVPWDLAHQKDVVSAAASRAEADDNLAKYRATQTTIVNTFVVVYRALALAGTQTDDPSLTVALQSAADLVASVKALMGGKS